ncbi:TetR family transcriptional regulator [Actinomycetospora succinea]|uniref:TetR family transcriptional regulator n=1 Tax=Actinomycetospora succinea TaxID=663603 RepID=A0A4R6VSD8_9PSEU|nr:TetR/AcrR family transcriptional regulator [Actinomycetospora succinea]TDQ62820.1 TetR family transcriptional regulator [Actinomycetospora succinea]
MDKVPTRDRILLATAELFRRQGYTGTGLKAVVAEAGAPFGSLYHHFPGGKQQLSEEVIHASGAYFQALVMAAYDEQSTTADSVWAVFAGAAETLEQTDYADACPIATVALEVASTDDVLRRATAEVFTAWVEALTERLDGDRDRATAVICALEGAFVLSRALRSTEPMFAAGRLALAGLG